MRAAFLDLVLSGLFPSTERSDGGPLTRRARFPPYKHQVQMLRRGLQTGSPGVVTSGTGSGKTEAFLLPLLARISAEAVTWPAPDEGYLQGRWWHDDRGRPYSKRDRKDRRAVRYTAIPGELRPLKNTATRSPFARHRAGENRPAAVRALVLYPMNALVEDQLVRLRRALDSNEARGAMEDHFDRNRIFFGRYTGATRVTGHHLHPGFAGLLATPARDVVGDVYFPDHPRAGDDGRVLLADVRQAELERRQRKLAELFEHMVALERGQIEARLHALDRAAALRLRELVNESGRELDRDTFVTLAEQAGRRTLDGLLRDFRTHVGEVPDGLAADLSDQILREADARVAPSAFGPDDAPFMFPSVDGSEMTNRWDMQETPPDILITNVSMLSAMLNREVEQPIFEQTREWLQKPGAYFYLVLDELHLQRGAAGTEVSYLLRLLLHRLGLTQTAEQRRKIRILASSASLPASPEEEAEASAQYLWDMFGPFGLEPEAVPDAQSGKSAWAQSIIPGDERAPAYADNEPQRLDPEPFVRLLEVHATPSGLDEEELPLARPLFAIEPTNDASVREAWEGVCAALGVVNGSLGERIHQCASEVAERLAWACREEDEGRPGRLRSRALPITELADKLLAWDSGQATDRAKHIGVRGLLFVRGVTDGLQLTSSEPLPAFRVHTFFRSIEGLYAPATRALGSRQTSAQRRADIGVLGIEQAARVYVPGDGEHRLFEVIYCEACGETLLGGMRAEIGSRSRYLAELLPQEPNLEGLPDQSVSQRFEELSWDQYALFWPGAWHTNSLDHNTDAGDRGRWVKAYLERQTGGVLRADRVDGEPGPQLLRGWYYARERGADRPHRRQADTAGTHVPYACPQCGTSYSGRRGRQYRLSPLRNFRTGFAKTTQLLATELFDAQRVSNPGSPPKLVSFSDSRQDAAKAALSIERFHHQDIRREVLLSALMAAGSSVDVIAISAEVEDVRAALPSVDSPLRVVSEEYLASLETRLAEAEERSVPLSAIIEDPADVGGTDRLVLPYVAGMIRLGVHPYDDIGQDRPLGKQADKPMRFHWHTMFREDERDGGVYWRDDEENQIAIVSAREGIASLVHRSLTDVVFSKTYFSFEEAGLGFVTVALASLPSERRTRSRVLELASFIRVLSDCYRYWPTPYRGADEPHAPWTVPGEVTNRRVQRFAQVAWSNDPEEGIRLALADLEGCGHRAGVIRMGFVRIELVEPDAEHVRCANCGRVHLHAGASACTRCFETMDWESSERVAVRQLHVRNFLARRLYRQDGGAFGGDLPAFRLHCEELTGQTEDPATRQREFRGIFVPRLLEIEPEQDQDGEQPEADGFVLDVPDPLLHRKQEIDLLAVTTTMEVGIDIGPLQVVLQANMPPQRFNYQQRVGRAGRRGQAFSMALTICRTKSHDLFYFRRPKAITGDIPPTPFLSKTMGNIAERFLRKGWLTAAFSDLRGAVRQSEVYPGDLMSPPDIHGEYVPTSFLPVADGVDWWARAQACIEARHGYAEELAALFVEGEGAFELEAVAEALRTEVEVAVGAARQFGLAHALAEGGYLPMYGMPTRVRHLYLGLGWTDARLCWSRVDRDLDIAIYEFAPAASLVIDKREHLSVGFTPDLADPLRGVRDQTIRAYQESPFSAAFRLVECGVCRAWRQLDDELQEAECSACGSELQVDLARDCRVPNAFRTDLPVYPRSQQEGLDAGTRHRSIQAEGATITLDPTAPFGPSTTWTLAMEQQSGMTFRLNRGPVLDDGERAFEYRIGSESLTRGSKSRTQAKYRLNVPHQAVTTEGRLAHRVANTFQPGGQPERVWLAAPKVTDALYLAPGARRPGLALHRLPGRVDSGTPPPEVVRWLGIGVRLANSC